MSLVLHAKEQQEKAVGGGGGGGGGGNWKLTCSGPSLTLFMSPFLMWQLSKLVYALTTDFTSMTSGIQRLSKGERLF